MLYSQPMSSYFQLSPSMASSSLSLGHSHLSVARQPLPSPTGCRIPAASTPLSLSESFLPSPHSAPGRRSEGVRCPAGRGFVITAFNNSLFLFDEGFIVSLFFLRHVLLEIEQLLLEEPVNLKLLLNDALHLLHIFLDFVVIVLYKKF